MSRLPTDKSGGPANAHARRSVVDRWTLYVVEGSTAETDLKTLAGWAAHLAVSTTVLREACNMLGIKPQDARDLMRALFAMLRSAQLGCPPEVLLDIADHRTLRSFQKRAGPNFGTIVNVESITRFLESQAFVDSQNYGVIVLRSLVTERLSQIT